MTPWAPATGGRRLVHEHPRRAREAGRGMSAAALRNVELAGPAAARQKLDHKWRKALRVLDSTSSLAPSPTQSFHTVDDVVDAELETEKLLWQLFRKEHPKDPKDRARMSWTVHLPLWPELPQPSSTAPEPPEPPEPAAVSGLPWKAPPEVSLATEGPSASRMGSWACKWM
eukprot:Skav232486  [mRNA]  locus=scaffold2877:333516:335920:- [translate_table: standard]